MLCLSLDPATTTGWALFNDDCERVGSGAWNLPKDHVKRVCAMREHLAQMASQYDGEIVAVFYEEPNRIRSHAQARVAFALETVIVLACDRYDWLLRGVNATQIKAEAGHGRNEKVDMERAAMEQFHRRVSHDEADALWLGWLGIRLLGWR